MKTAVSIPDDLFKRAEAEAKRRGVSRSKLYQEALEMHLAQKRSAELKRRINKSIEKYGDPSEGMEPWLDASLKSILENSEWDD
ncbi:MAG: CopG family transcriptional regulator [Hyphomicrobium sp.]|nr:CopG family transcriptional regulator [Hyphomicrobium sp.]